MGSRDSVEKILRNMHLMLSKSEPYAKEATKVIIDKEQMLELLNELNHAVYDIMEEYELTKQSRDRAEREFRKRGDEIILDASHKAEDVYAASVMYTDEALTRVLDIMRENRESIDKVYKEMDQNLKEQTQLLKKNQLELKSQLQDLVDTEKYVKLIEERNRELQKEKEKKNGCVAEKPKETIYANRRTEIKVNEEYFEKLKTTSEKEQPLVEGVSEVRVSKEKAPIDKDTSSEEGVESNVKLPEADIRINLDAEYFKWKAKENGKSEKAKEGPDKSETEVRSEGMEDTTELEDTVEQEETVEQEDATETEDIAELENAVEIEGKKPLSDGKKTEKFYAVLKNLTNKK